MTQAPSMAQEGEVRVRNVRTQRGGGFIESLVDFGGGIVRLVISVVTLPLILLPRETRMHLNNATRELVYAFADLPRDLANAASEAIEDWARDAGAEPAKSQAPRDEMARV